MISLSSHPLAAIALTPALGMFVAFVAATLVITWWSAKR
jgi:hypothetical protein